MPEVVRVHGEVQDGLWASKAVPDKFALSFYTERYANTIFSHEP